MSLTLGAGLRRFNNPEWPKFLTEEDVSHPATSDLVFVCQNQVVYSQQSIVAPYSTLLSKLFSGYGCCACKSTKCTRRDLVQIVMEIKGETMRRILSILHSGQVLIKHRRHEEEVKTGMEMLGISIGELETVMSRKKNSKILSKVKSVAYFNPEKFTLKRRLSNITSATNPVNAQVEMAEDLSGISMDCIIEGCESGVSLSNMTTHFQSHISQNEARDSNEQQESVSFSCNLCQKKFCLRKALDFHNKKYHRKPENSEIKPETIDNDYTNVCKRRKIDMNNQIEIFKFAFHNVNKTTMDDTNDSDLIETDVDIPTSSQDEKTPTIDDDDILLPKIERTTFEASYNIETMNNSSNEGRKERVSQTKIKSQTKKMVKQKTKQPYAWTIERKDDKTSCQICQEKFENFAKLKTHYTKEHYWFKLYEDYSLWQNKCFICLKKYPTNDHLLQHMGNFHTCLTLDKYLESEGRPILTIEWTVKLLNPKCPFKDCMVDKKTSAELKGHLAQKHFASEFEREFPVDKIKIKKCAKCSKTFKSKSLRISHLGAFHDEVLKYAADMISVDSIDRNIIPVNDFIDGAKGKNFKMEENQDDLLNPKHDENKRKTTLFEESINVKEEFVSEEIYICSLEDCVQECTSKENYTLHLYTKHYRKEVEREFREALEADSSRCPLCKKQSKEWGKNDNDLLKHIAVDHEYVQKYLKKDLLIDPEVSIKKEEKFCISPLLVDTISLLETDPESDGANTS